MIIVIFVDLLVQMIYDNLMKAFKLNGGTVMYKLIVCDMDETLLADNKTITPKTVEAIKRAVKKASVFHRIPGAASYPCRMILRNWD